MDTHRETGGPCREGRRVPRGEKAARAREPGTVAAGQPATAPPPPPGLRAPEPRDKSSLWFPPPVCTTLSPQPPEPRPLQLGSWKRENLCLAEGGISYDAAPCYDRTRIHSRVHTGVVIGCVTCHITV